MLNSLAAGRHLAKRIVIAQLVVAVVAGLAFTLQGRSAGLAAFGGALIVAIATALLAARAFGALGGAGATFARFLVGMILRWIILIGGLALILVQWNLPPLPALAGLVAGYAVNVFAFRFKG
ncbi:ATP synthase subunit I [Luteibacter sahnii]|uniref:ATP synthase subunit I n=1 Tax=Luteibacter sahnii TaxID=3021977 RepID=UPI002A6AE383|nr:ATP synthase subunit I [Luteibacter sp. PPL193]MDY1548922.1 ATP synthase subunit I [Luteibacter sp. PPL193]